LLLLSHSPSHSLLLIFTSSGLKNTSKIKMSKGHFLTHPSIHPLLLFSSGDKTTLSSVTPTKENFNFEEICNLSRFGYEDISRVLMGERFVV
jgi:hypothetical protein